MNANDLLKTFLTPLVRTLLGSAAGWLAARGVLAADQSSQFVDSGLALAFLGAAYGWSVWQKRRAHHNTEALIRVAVKAPTTTTVEDVKTAAAEAGRLKTEL